MNYYLLLNRDQRLGPLSKHQLLEAGMLESSLVWHSGLPDWKQAHEFPELVDLFAPVDTPPDLLAEEEIPPPVPDDLPPTVPDPDSIPLVELENTEEPTYFSGTLKVMIGLFVIGFIVFLSCYWLSDSAADFSLTDVEAHLRYQKKTKDEKALLKEYQQLFLQHPDSPELRFLLARIETNSIERQKMIQEALKKKPDSYWDNIAMGEYYFEKELHQPAINFVKRATDLADSLYYGHYLMGQITENYAGDKYFLSYGERSSLLQQATSSYKKAKLRLHNEFTFSLTPDQLLELVQREQENLNKDFPCHLNAGTFVGDMHQGYVPGKASITLDENCGCTCYINLGYYGNFTMDGSMEKLEGQENLYYFKSKDSGANKVFIYKNRIEIVGHNWGAMLYKQ
jgi:hypothetical protein